MRTWALTSFHGSRPVTVIAHFGGVLVPLGQRRLFRLLNLVSLSSLPSCVEHFFTFWFNPPPTLHPPKSPSCPRLCVLSDGPCVRKGGGGSGGRF